MFVMRNYDDFMGDSHSLIKGFNAAIAAFHMADHYYYYNNPKKIKQFKKRDKFVAHLSDTNEYFRNIQSIANVYKHLYEEPLKHGSIKLNVLNAVKKIRLNKSQLIVA